METFDNFPVSWIAFVKELELKIWRHMSMSASTTKSANGQIEGQPAATDSTTEVKAESKSASPIASSQSKDGKADEAAKAGGLVVQGDAGKATQIQPYATPLPNGRPIFPRTFDYIDSDNLPGARPIALSTFKTFALLPGDRPIMASNFKAVAMLPESRPIMAKSFDYVDSDGLPGGRPIAKNHSEEIKVLIGYLD